MSRGKHLSLEEARKTGALKQFAKEHPSTGDKDAFDSILNALIKTPPTNAKTSDRDASED